MNFVSGEWVPDLPVSTTEQPIQVVLPQEEKKLVAVLPFIEKERHEVINLLKRSIELSGQIQRTILLVPFKGLSSEEIEKEARKAFANVGVIQDSEGIVSDWNERSKMRSAAGPNSLFRQAAWYFYLKKPGPWLWLEPDCWPMTERWFYELEQEYLDANKPFMGVRMTLADGRQYMNGVGVYPPNCIQFAPLLVQSALWNGIEGMEVGFDVAGGQDVLNHAFMSRKIQLVSHLAKGNNMEVRPETVLCHGRINISGVGSTGSNEAVEAECRQDQAKLCNSAPPSTLLDANGVAGEPQTGVLSQSLPPTGCVPPHETRDQDPTDEDGVPLSSYAKRNPPIEIDGESGYGDISKEIRYYIENLVSLWDNQPHRKVAIVRELRRARLVPKHFR